MFFLNLERYFAIITPRFFNNQALYAIQKRRWIMLRKTSILAAIVAIFSFCCQVQAAQISVSWDGGDGSTWADANNWEPGTYNNIADFNLDGQVNFKDFVDFAESWLWQASWY